MKNTPSKLLLALTMCFSVAIAHAEGDNNSKNSHSNKDNTGKSSNVKATDSCTAVVVATPCGPVQKTTCSSTTGASVITAAQKNKDDERHKYDSDSKDNKDHVERNHSDNSKYSSRASSKDDGDNNYGKPYGYHWEQDNGSGKPKQRKVTICHREGGARTTIDVDDDGRYQGHHNDPMDTEGNCEHQDDKSGKHTDGKNSGRDVVHIHKATVCGTPRAYIHKEDGKHHQERAHESDKNDSSSKYRTRNTSQDDKDYNGATLDLNKHRAGYRWEHDVDGTAAHKQRKVVICHRMGNARVTLDVDDDGWFHGHDKHPMDTEGRCEDQNDTTKKHTDATNNGKPVVPLATEAACSPAAATSTTTTSSAACINAGGVAAVLAGAGCGTAGTSCAPLASGARPNRGGVRNVR